MKRTVTTWVMMFIVSLGLNAQTMKEQIINKVKQVFESTDARNWEGVARAFAPEVRLDYTSMAGGDPVTLSPAQIVESWSGLLPGFDKTRHMVHGFQVSQEPGKASVTNQGTANHYLNGETWTVVGHYEFELKKLGEEWRVSQMKFYLEYIDGNTELPRLAKERMEGRLTNYQVVDRFFEALETQQFEWLKEVFAQEGKQLNPYVPAGFPASFEGREAIFKQYSGLTEHFGAMKFPREIFTTSDPDFLFVKFRGEIDIKAGGRYENDYLGTFRLKDGKIIEYTEYFNPIVMAKAFGLKW